MKSDSDIKRDVELELQWDPDIDVTDIAVAVKSGVVTLTGFVRSYAQKWQAERDAKRIAGVVAVANDIEVSDHNEAVLDAASVLKEYIRVDKELTERAKDILEIRGLPYSHLGRTKRQLAD